MSSATLFTFTIVASFVLIHLFVGKVRSLDVFPRSGWLSFAGGAAVAYIFLHVLPELAAHQQEFSEVGLTGNDGLDIWIYALSMAGLVLFYGLERWAKLRHADPSGDMDDSILWIHTGSFALYSFLIGYLLNNREDSDQSSLVLYAVAIAFHLVTTDHGMRRDHGPAYDRISRWVLAVAVLAGWIAGLALALPPVVIGCLFAFLAGGVVLNVLKEELPEERESRFGPFLAGIIFYAGLLIAERITG